MGRKRLAAIEPSSAGAPAADDAGQLSRSLLRGLDILKAFQPGRAILSNGDIAAATGLPKPTVSRLTRALTESGYLVADSATGKYQLSPSVLSLGFTVLGNMPILNVSHVGMQQIANMSGCAVSLACRDGLHLVYLDRCSSEAMPYFMAVGARIEIARTAAGRAYLAALPEAARGRLMAQLAAHYGPDWEALSTRIDDGVAQVRQRGFCVVENDWRLNVRAVAAPVVAGGGRNVFAINCAGPAFSVSTERLVAELGPRVVHLCQTLSSQF